MNQQAYESGKAAYQGGDWLGAVASLMQAKQPGEVSGEVDHLLGNANMKLGRYSDAATAYTNALADANYGKRGALSCNLGRALIACGRTQEAISALSEAVSDQTYATPYKAYMALGGVYESVGDVRNAGMAYRSAAIDEANPSPATALSKLGSCFMRLGRPVDAVEAYRTALDFTTPLQSQAQVYCELGLAYVAANRMSEAVDAFDHASSEQTYTFSPEAQASYDAARKAVAHAGAKRSSDTDALLAAAGYGDAMNGFDPLDPMGESGELIPSAEDTGFFSVTEADLIAEDKRARKVKRKHKHTGLKVFIVLLVLVLLVGGAGVFCYWRGYGYPTQQSVVESLFQAKTNGTGISDYVSSSLSDSQRQSIEDVLPSGADVEISGTDQSMKSSTVVAKAKLSQGGEVDYTIELVRDGISWKVSSVSTSFVSE